MRGHRHLIFFPLAALLAILPLIFKGPSCGHDFEFHLRSWLEVSSQWKQGTLFPHWEFTAAWNSGEPRFVFYPPLSWTIGAFLGILLPWSVVPTTFIWLALMACGFTMYRLACQWTISSNALIAAAFYMVHPYMLFTFYERAAYAELLAAAWIPLLFLAVLRPRLTLPSIAIPIVLLWLTNAPAAVIGCYTLALLSAIRLIFTYRSTQSAHTILAEAGKLVTGTLLGIGIAAFYILPATIEQHWVQITMPFIRGVRFQDNFLFGHLGNPSHDAILRTASLCGVSLLALSAIFTVAALNSGSGERHLALTEGGVRRRTILSLFFTSCVIAFLLTSPSAVLWFHLPELRFLQFPWRFCIILGTTAAALLAMALPRTGRLPVIASTAIALALPPAVTLGGNSFFRQFCHPHDAISSRVANFYSGMRYDPTDEYTPIGAAPEALQHTNPAFWMAAAPTDAAPQTAASNYSIVLARRRHFLVYTPIPRFLILSLRDYPAWQISVNGTAITSHPRRKDGLIALPVASGSSKVDIVYAYTQDQTEGWVVTALSAVLLLFLSIPPKRRRNA
jgi:hypothetical protein